MDEEMKKITTLVVITLLFSIMLIPAINAEKEDTQGILNYDLLIITPAKFMPMLKPLKDHKENNNVSTKMVSLAQVYARMALSGRDHAEKIKYYIKMAMEKWDIKYVLLVGGMRGQLNQWYLPVRYVYTSDDWEDAYISDLYYADIYDANGSFSCWDHDGDMVFGEWLINESADDTDIDLYPDIAVGRLPVRNMFEVKIMVDKIIHYETNTSGQSWFNDMIVIAGDTYPEHQNPLWKGYEGEYYADCALENMSSFNPVKLYTSDGSFSSQDDVINAVSNGSGFLYFVGHGSPQNWGNHPPDDAAFITGLSTKSMHKLDNGDKLPICVVSGCHNSQFDVTILNFIKGLLELKLKYFNWEFYLKEWVPECWGWRMTRKIDGGSIATIGCTALGYTKEDKDSFTGGLNELEVKFFEEYEPGVNDTLGDIWANAISSYVDDYSDITWNQKAGCDSWIDVKVVGSWVIFGDPSLKIGGYP